MMSKYFPRIQIFALITSLLIYELRTWIQVSYYWWFNKTQPTVKMETLKLNPASYIIPYTFTRIYIGWCSYTSLFPYIFFPTIDVSMAYKFCGAKLFFHHSSLQYVWYISLYCIWWTFTWFIIDIGVVNQRLSQLPRKFYKSFICLKEIFHCQICIHFSTLYVKNITLRWATRLSSNNYPNQFETLSHHNASVHCDFPPPPCIYNVNQYYRRIELYYLIIHHPSFLLLNLWHSQIWEDWHHHYIKIRFFPDINIKLGII